MNFIIKTYRFFLRLLLALFIPFWMLWLLVVIIILKFNCLIKNSKEKPRLLWGPDAIINNRYWANAMKRHGYQALSFVYEQSSFICKSHEYDKNLETTVPFYNLWKRSFLYRLLGRDLFDLWTPYFATVYALTHADIFHFSFNGGMLRDTILKKIEPRLLHFCGKKIVVSSFGSDAYCFYEIKDPSLQHALLMSQSRYARESRKIQNHVLFWSKHADIIISGGAIDGLPRWDVLSQNHLAIDCEMWKPKTNYSQADGRNNVVKVVHTPNHRGFKGTEFLVKAVEELKQEGFKLELILLEGVENTEVMRVLREEADILAEQFVYSGYALSGIEGMVSGLPVMGNLETEVYAKLFKRYSFLGECPIYSTSIEKIKENLEFLITNPDKREVLGRAGRQYVEQYHSYDSANHLLSSIYKKIWYDEEIDLLKLYHPLFQCYTEVN